MAFRFGEFLVDAASRQILRNGEPVALSPKAFELLNMLLTENPRAVPKAELIERLWAGSAVSEENLKTRILEIRKALGEKGRHSKWIRTAHGFGYACVGTVYEQSAEVDRYKPAQLYWLQHSSRGFAVTPGETLVGRDPRCGVWIDDSSVSRRHARLFVSDSGVILEDLGSKNGTSVGVTPVRAAIELLDGDRITFGSVNLVFRSKGLVDSTESAPVG